MFGDKNDLMVRTGARERTDAAIYSILRLFSTSKTERKHLKKAARTKRRDARRLKKLSGEKSRTSAGGVLLGLAEYLILGKESYYREEAAKERSTGRSLASFLKESPGLDRIVIHSEKRAKRDERFSDRSLKITVREGKKSQKRTARRTKRAFRRVNKYFKR